MDESDPSNDGVGEVSSIRKKVNHPSSRSHISLPRLKKVKRDLLTDLPLDSQECQQEILSVMKKSFHWPISLQTHEFRRVQSINNPELTSKYLEKRREWKSNGYTDSLLTDTYAFLPVESQTEIEKICRNGVRCGNQAFSGLGVSHMAVQLSKHADILVPSKQSVGDKICILVKLLKGKVKTVLCKNVGVQLEPTPNYDCHIAKPNVEQPTNMPYHLLFYSMQLYVYEYGDLGVEDYPKQVLPFAVIHYTMKEPSVIPKQVSNISRGIAFKSEQQMVYSSTVGSTGVNVPLVGPRNEVWRGKLHVSLIDGGKLNIEVCLFSSFVPLTVNLLSPLKIHKLYPESSAQTTYFAGLTDIADKAEVPWREHFFRSFLMRPRQNSENHFKALVQHISDKREMPCVGLPNDIYLFMMSKCLLSSQLGLVQREDNSPVLYCVSMSKFSTIKAEKKKMKQRMGNAILRHYGKARSWPELFDDSDDDEEDDSGQRPSDYKIHRQHLDTLFHEQKLVHNKLASLSLADVAANVSPCDCVLNGNSALHQRNRRNSDITHMVSGIQASIRNHRSKSKEAVSFFPSGSRTKPKLRMSRRSRTMPSFSPHGSSDSDSDYEVRENGKRSKGRKDYSVLMNSNKTIEEELSEEELTAEQMDDIIFLRKPATSVKAKSSLFSKSESKQTIPDKSLSEKSPFLFSSKPRIIPVDPLVETVLEISSPSRDSNNSPEPTGISVTKIIPTDPVINSPKNHQSPSNLSHPAQSDSKILCNKPQQNPLMPKSILKNKRSFTESSLSTSSIPCNLKNRKSSNPGILKSQSSTSHILKISEPPPLLSSSLLSESVDNSVLNCKVWHPTNVTAQGSILSTCKINLSFTETDKASTTKKSTHFSTSEIRNTLIATPCTKIGVDSSSQQTKSDADDDISAGIWSSALHLEAKHLDPLPLTGDMGDVDMRIPLSHFQTAPFITSSIPAVKPSLGSAAHQPLSPSLALGSWLAPQDLPPNSKDLTCVPHTSSSSSSTSLSFQSSPFKPCAPVEEQFDIDVGIASPPSTSPPSPSPLDSPMSPPKSPTIELESPASPPMSSCVSELRSSPIAIPTVRLQRSLLPSFPISCKPGSPSPRKIVDNDENQLVKQVENADDMKDFLNSETGFDSEVESPNEDDREGCLPKEMENADDMNDFLNAAIGFESESPYEDER